MKNTHQKAFTLIELLVVITIMATITGIAVLSIRGKDSDTLAEREANRLFSLFTMTSDDAVLKNQQYGIRFTELGYDFYWLGENRQWVKLNQNILKSHSYPLALETQLWINGIVVEIDDSNSLETEIKDQKKIKPHIFILSDGEIRPDFEIKLLNSKTESMFLIKPGESSLISYEKVMINDGF